MANNPLFITGRESVPMSLLKKSLNKSCELPEVVKASTIFEKPTVKLPTSNSGIYTSPFATIGNVAEEVGKKLDISAG